MEIRKYDPTGDLLGVKKLLEEDTIYFEKFQKASMSSDDVIYIADCDGEAAGLLMLQRFSRFRVTPFIYVHKKYRHKGIGKELILFSDKILSDGIYEHAICEFNADESIANFLTKNGYRHYYSLYLMERNNMLIDTENINDAVLLKKGIIIRIYKDEDYLAWHNIIDGAFFLMRQKIGLTPSYYYPPSESERKAFTKNFDNKYVMTVDEVVIAACRVDKNDIALLGVRPDQQHKGYGRTMIAYLNNKFINEQNAEKVTIEVIDGNPAKRLYDSLGFHDVGYKYYYIKYFKPDSRQIAPKGYATEEEILNEFKLHGMLKEEMNP